MPLRDAADGHVPGSAVGRPFALLELLLLAENLERPLDGSPSVCAIDANSVGQSVPLLVNF